MLSKIAEPFLNCSTPSLPRSSSEYAELRCFDWGNSTWNQLAASSTVCGTVFVIAWPAFMFCTIARHRDGGLIDSLWEDIDYREHEHRDQRDEDVNLSPALQRRRELFQTRYGWMYIRYCPECW